MRSRTFKEGSVGLLILAGVGLFVGLALWLRGFQVGTRPYRLQVELADAIGIDVGSAVRYRGVRVGTVTEVKPTPNGVLLGVAITQGKLLIPRPVLAEASQSGFIGQTTLDLRPQGLLATNPSTQGLSPFGNQCNRQLILCDGDRLEGEVGVSFDELIRATTQIATLLDDSELIMNTNTALKNFSTTATRIDQLTAEARVQLRSFGTAASSVTRAANQVGALGDRFNTTVDRFNTTADRITHAADQVTGLIEVNRGSLTSTLNNMNAASAELKGALTTLSPFISRVEQSQLLDNLETLAANGAKASTNLRDLSATLNNPITILGLAQTLDSARVTFLNAQKITTDLDRLTGDPAFQKNFLRLINSLNKLVSSTQALEQQLQAVSPEAETAAPPAPAAPPSSPPANPQNLADNKTSSPTE